MEITFEDGNYGKGDKLIFFETKKLEPVTIFKIALMTNQMAFNEMVTKNGRYKQIACMSGEYQKIEKNCFIKDDPKGKIFFREAINEAMNMGIIGINWAEKNNLSHVERWCTKWYIKMEAIDELRRTFQRGLKEWN